MRNHAGIKLFRFLLAVLIVFSFTSILGGWTSDYADGSKQIMENINVNASLAKNGDMKVQEIWKVNLKDRGKAYRNLYETFTLDPSKADGITDLSVYDKDQKLQYSFAGDIDPENVNSDKYKNQCYIHSSSGETEIGWFLPEIDEGIRTFSVTYTIKNIVHVHSDTAELYYKFVPDKFSLPITKMKGTITFPSGAEKSSLRTWLHTTASNSIISIDSAKQVSFSLEQNQKNTFVEVRILMPVQLFPDSTRKSGESAFSSIQATEMQQAQQYRGKVQAEQQRQYILGMIDAIAAPVILIICVVLFVVAKRKSRRLKVDVPEYTRDIPLGNSPAGIANLFYFYNGIGEKENNRIFSATILSLAQKGYLQFLNQETKTAIHITGNTKGIELTTSEQIFFEIISTVAETYENTFTMEQFKKYSQVHYNYIDRKIAEFLSESKREISGRGYYRVKPAYLSIFIVVGILMAFLAFALFGISGSIHYLLIYIPLALIIGGVLLIIAGAAKPKLSEKGEYDFGVWHGLKKYMLDFSRMKEYGIPELTLWEEYLVYATMMGISSEVCKQLKFVYPQLTDSAYWDSYPTYSYLPYIFWTHNGYGMQSVDFDFGSVLGNTIGDISSAATRLAHPPTSGNGGFGGGSFGGGGFGGGGFSGGGGGFGGGGGGVR